MDKLKTIVTTMRPGVFSCVFVGRFDERTELPAEMKGHTFHLNLGGVDGLSSIGTRFWCEWIRKLPPGSKIYVEEVPPIFVKCFNQVDGSLPTAASVESFYVPFIGVDSGHRKDVLFRKGEHFSDKGEVSTPDVKGAEGELFEADVLPNYFSFLKR